MDLPYRSECCIGSVVRYDETNPQNTDEFTKELMEKFLIDGNTYTIKEVRRSNYQYYDDHYRFSEESTQSYWFPCNSFILVFNREFIKNKYGLK